MRGLNMECADTFQGQPLEQVPLHKLQVQNLFMMQMYKMFKEPSLFGNSAYWRIKRLSANEKRWGIDSESNQRF